MKKFLLVSIVALSTLLVASLIILAYFVIQNNKKAREETSQRQNLKTFESRLYKFRFDYPDTLFLQSGENASLLPGNIKLANFENKENQPEDAVFYEIKVIDDNETKVLKKTADYAQIAEMTKNKYKSEDITLGSKEAVKLTNSEKIKENVVSIFCLWEKKIYRIDFLPQTVSTYEKNRDGLSTILSSFAFLSDADFVSAFQNRALAASSCDSIDQQYAPETKIYTEPLGTAAVDGQTFMPTKTSICKIAIDLEDVTSSQTGTIWLYTEGGQELARKTQNISDGWNTFVLDATVTVTPEAVYKIMFNINGDTGPKWRAGETDISDGYSRGHAITNNHDETDLDFHFKEYYLTGSDTNQNVNQNKNQNANTSTKKRGTSNTNSSQETSSAAPKQPFNLKIIKLRLTGLTENYVDLEWDKVTDEDLAGYVLYYGEESSLYYFSIDNGTANTVRVKNLRPSKTYYFVVKAYDKSGYLSGPSNEVEASMVKSARSSYFWIIYIIAALLCASIGTLIWYKKKEKNASAKLA